MSSEPRTEALEGTVSTASEGTERLRPRRLHFDLPSSDASQGASLAACLLHLFMGSCQLCGSAQAVSRLLLSCEPSILQGR